MSLEPSPEPIHAVSAPQPTEKVEGAIGNRPSDGGVFAAKGSGALYDLADKKAGPGRGYGDLTEELLAKVPDLNLVRVAVDVGAGTGRSAKAIAELCPNLMYLVAIEPAEGMRAQIETNVSTGRLYVHEDDALTGLFKLLPDCADLVVANQVVHWFPFAGEHSVSNPNSRYVSKCFSAIHETLRVGHYFAFSTQALSVSLPEDQQELAKTHFSNHPFYKLFRERVLERLRDPEFKDWTERMHTEESVAVSSIRNITTDLEEAGFNGITWEIRPDPLTRKQLMRACLNAHMPLFEMRGLGKIPPEIRVSLLKETFRKLLNNPDSRTLLNVGGYSEILIFGVAIKA